MVRTALTVDLDVPTLYAILQLRSAIFVVEQECAFLDLDGRDLEDQCVQLWVADTDGAVVATARVLHEGDDRRIGRVCTAAGARRQGVGAELMHAGIDLAGERTIWLDAQAQLVDWYATFGFVPTGRRFYEDSIPHAEMRRP